MCVVPENSHTHPKEGYYKTQGVWRFEIQCSLEKHVPKLEFPADLEGGGPSNQKETFRGRGMDIFWNNTMYGIYKI